MENSNNGISRLIIPLLAGAILYAQIYILHFFDEMEFSVPTVLIFIAIVVIVFEIDLFISRKFQSRANSSHGFFRTLLLPFLTSLGICLLFVFAIYIPEKLWEIRNGAVDTIGWFHIISIGSHVFFIVAVANAFHQAQFHLRKWREETIRSARLEKENAKASLATLRNQISPHFLFNNFNTLYGLIRDKPADAQIFLLRLSSLYRKVLATKNEELVSLKEEMETLNHYLFLIKVRFSKVIWVNIEIGRNNDQYYIPPMTLQLLMENAIKHNHFDEEQPLKISLIQEEDKLIVKNNLSGKKPEVHSTGIGLQNIRNRFALLSDQNISILASENEFQVQIPLLQITQLNEIGNQGGDY